MIHDEKFLLQNPSNLLLSNIFHNRLSYIY